LDDGFKARAEQMGEELVSQIEKYAYLGAIDKQWIEHIDYIDGLREGVRLRAYGQRNPLVEFKNEAFTAFEGHVDRIDSELARRIFRIGVARAPRPEIPLEAARTNVDTTDSTGLTDTKPEPDTNNKKSLGRNDPCWCGSGKKWKKCHYPQLSQ
jgi:preprotein translocase subunit SecA